MTAVLLHAPMADAREDEAEVGTAHTIERLLWQPPTVIFRLAWGRRPKVVPADDLFVD